MVAIALPVLLSACLSTTATYDASTDSAPINNGVLTPDAAAPADAYVYQRDAGNMSVSADPSNTGGNLRELYWPSDAPITAAEQSCETWTGASGAIDQQGIALRIAPTADGLGTRAVTVTKNIWFYGYWLFNVHIWDSSSASQYTLLASLDYSSIIGSDLYHITPYPWHVCARVSGSIFQVMLWVGDNPQPSWSDGSAVQQVTLPDGWDYPGAAGWYIGHLETASTDTFTDMKTWSLKGTLDSPTTSTTSTTDPTSTTTTSTTVAGP